MSDELREFDKTQEQPHVLRAELERVKRESAAVKTDWPNCKQVQCKQVHNYMDALMESLGVENDPDVYVVGKAVRIQEKLNSMVSRAEVRPIWEACQKLLTGLHATALNNPEFYNAYDRAREAARELGLLEDKP